MLKSWEISPFQRASEATTRHPRTAYTDRITVAASSGRSRQRPEKPMATPQRPSRNAAQSAKCPSSVMEEVSGLGNGLVAGTTFGQDVGGPDDAISAQPALDHDFDVVGVGKGVGHESPVGDRVGLHP